MEYSNTGAARLVVITTIITTKMNVRAVILIVITIIATEVNFGAVRLVSQRS